MQRLIPIQQRGSRTEGAGAPTWMKATTAIGFIAIIAFGLYFGIAIFGPKPIPPPITLKGEIYPYVEAYAGDDTTNIDGAGTYEFWDADSNPEKIEPALTWGTSTHTTKDYESGQIFWFVCKSTTANAIDHFAWKVTLPFSNELGTPTAEARDTMLWDVEWDAVNEYWTIHFYACQESQPTIKAKTELGEDVGTTAIDMSDNGYEYTVEVRIAIASGNYDGFGFFFDPDEGADGKMDSLYLCLTSNVSAANMGFTIGGTGWKACDSANDFYIKLDDYIAQYGIGNSEYGLFMRWDEEAQETVFSVYFTIESSDLDTSGAGALLLTLNMYECSDDEDAAAQTWDSDSPDNFSTDPTAETATFQD